LTTHRRRNRPSRKAQRLAIIVGLGFVISASVGLVLAALRDQIIFFYSPSDLAAVANDGRPLRIGGLVQEGSWQRAGNGNSFVVTDGGADIAVYYSGILPDLFREGQGVVVEGQRDARNVVQATNVLAKHDENYMPKEVVDALRKTGEWQHGDMNASSDQP
jgi:cytochrome c-type biogenesis protein CcmE